jgi:hypothetical protein
MKFILVSIQTMSLTLILQFVIQWIKVFLLRTISTLDWIHFVLRTGNVIMLKMLGMVVLLELVIRGILALRTVYSFEMVTNGDRSTQDSTNLLECKLFEYMLNRNLLPGKMI